MSSPIVFASFSAWSKPFQGTVVPGMVCIQNDFHNGVHRLFSEITDAFFIGQPLDVDGLSILMPPKTAPKNIVESVQVPTDLPIQATDEHLLHLVIKTGHVRKAATVNGEHLSHVHINGSFKSYFSMILFSKAS